MSSIAKRPNGKWRARYRDPEGKEHARHFDLRREAEKWLAKQVTEVTEGTWVDPQAGRRTFGEYAERWLEVQIQHRPSTAATTRSRLRRQLIPQFGQRPIAAITRSEVQAWVTERSSVLKASTVEGLYRLLSQVMLAAKEDLVIQHSPCRRITLPALGESRVVIPSFDEVSAVIEAAPERARALIITTAATGMRISEVCGLTVDRIDFLRRTITVDRQLVGAVAGQPRFGPPKTRASVRTIPVPAEVTDAIAAHLARWPSESVVFTNSRGFPWTRQRLGEAWKGWSELAKIDCRFHWLRHLYASSLISSGQSVKVIQQRMGHGSAAVTLDTYGHLMPNDEEGTRLAVSAALGSLLRTARGLSS